MAITKKYLKSKPICKVTLRIPKEIGADIQEAHVVGEFNAWNTQATPMKKLKSGEFSVGLDLETGCEYQYRFLLNGTNWINDPEADKQVPTEFGDSENSVVVV